MAKKTPKKAKAKTRVPVGLTPVKTETGTRMVSTSELKPNPTNPRVLRDDKFAKLKASIQSFPDMLNKRPIVAVTDTDGKLMVLGGNMRLRACQELKMKEVPVILADEWTEEQRREFIIKDNVSFGEWDWDALANTWDAGKLDEWGVNVFKATDVDVNQFFEDNPAAGKSTANKLVLEYTDSDYLLVMDRLAQIGGTKEKAVFDLLVG